MSDRDTTTGAAEGRGLGRVVALVAAVAFLPFVGGVLGGGTFYFRDIAQHFFATRRFLVEGLLRGELRYWNPYLHEGEFFITGYPIGYPFDLLQLLVPNDWGFSLLLALHVSLAAVAMLFLARALGLSRLAGAGAAFVYALGGFCLSTLNLNGMLVVVAWTPLVVLALMRAATGGARSVALAALAVAVALSGISFEFSSQALLIGLLMIQPLRGARAWLRVLGAILLGAGLAAPLWLPIPSLIAGGARSRGLATDAILAYSIHPVTLLQTIIANLHADLNSITSIFWGFKFSPAPYFLSYYFGATALALALVAVLTRQHRYCGRLIVLAGMALLICLGPWGGLGLLLDHLPVPRFARFPSKAFFSVNFALALLVAQGLETLRSGSARAQRLLATLATSAGGLLVIAPALGWLWPALRRRLLEALFTPKADPAARLSALSQIVQDAALGGLIVLAVAALAWLMLRGRVDRRLALVGVVAIMTGDLLRTGAGLNPLAPLATLDLSPEMRAMVEQLRVEGGRFFTCEPELSTAFQWAKQGWGRRGDRFAHAIFVETLSPSHNLRFHMPSAYSRDLTMFPPGERLLPMEDVGCGEPNKIVGRLRRAGVAHILALLPLESPDLELRARLFPRRLEPLSVYVYRLRDPLPLRAVAGQVTLARGREEGETLAERPGFQAAGGAAVEGYDHEVSGARGSVESLHEGSDRVDLRVTADQATVVLVRDAFAPGWTATVNGAAAPVLRADGRHRAVPVGPGTSLVTLRYRLPGYNAGLAVAALSLILTLALLLRRPKAPTSPLTEPPSAPAA